MHSPLCVKRWQAQTPSVEEARPACCPRCEAPGRPIGQKLGLIGHGMRTRQVRGPVAPNQAPTTLALDIRRYVCTQCSAVITVLPRGVVPYRQFSGAAMGWALALWSIAKQSLRQVRQKLSPWQHLGIEAQTGWAAVHRWIRAIREGRLFSFIPAAPAWFTPRQVAERAAAALSTRALTDHQHEPLTEQAFHGGAQLP